MPEIRLAVPAWLVPRRLRPAPGRDYRSDPAYLTAACRIAREAEGRWPLVLPLGDAVPRGTAWEPGEPVATVVAEVPSGTKHLVLCETRGEWPVVIIDAPDASPQWTWLAWCYRLPRPAPRTLPGRLARLADAAWYALRLPFGGVSVEEHAWRTRERSWLREMRAAVRGSARLP